MKTAVFSAKTYDREGFEAKGIPGKHEFVFLDSRLSAETTSLAQGFEAVCVFVHDELDRRVLTDLKEYGVRYVALRCAGFNNVDVQAAKELGLKVVRVPAYSPNAIAEYALALILTLNRRIYRAYNRVREGNFSIEGLQGFDVTGKTVGIVGTGKIGAKLATIMNSMGCTVLGYDVHENPELAGRVLTYTTLQRLFEKSDIISLHCPLMPETHHLINDQAIALMKDKVMLINTGRGALIDTRAVIQGLKLGKIGYLGLDVYEEEDTLFFEDLSNSVIQDDTFARLLTFPNVVITSHQAFLTREALVQIAQITAQNLIDLELGQACKNSVVE